MEIATQGGVHIPRLVTDGMLEPYPISLPGCLPSILQDLA